MWASFHSDSFNWLPVPLSRAEDDSPVDKLCYLHDAVAPPSDYPLYVWSGTSGQRSKRIIHSLQHECRQADVSIFRWRTKKKKTADNFTTVIVKLSLPKVVEPGYLRSSLSFRHWIDCMTKSGLFCSTDSRITWNWIELQARMSFYVMTACIYS